MIFATNRFVLVAVMLVLGVAWPVLAQDETAPADSSATYVVEDEDVPYGVSSPSGRGTEGRRKATG